MLGRLKTLLDFINYWYFRYLMVTELYMVERWERIFFNTTVIILLSFLSYVNYVGLCFAKSLWTSMFDHIS